MSKIFKHIKKKINFFIWLNIKKSHQKYLRSKNLSIIRKIKSNFYNDTIELDINDYSKHVFTKEIFFKDRVIKQYIGKFLTGNKFLYLFYFFQRKKFKSIFCLPNSYLRYLENNHNLKINYTLSNFFFFTFVLRKFYDGLIFFFKIFFNIFRKKKNMKINNLLNYDSFVDFSLENFNISNNFNLEQYNIVNWVIKNYKTKNLILQSKKSFIYDKNNILIQTQKNITDNILYNINYKKLILKSLSLLVSSIFNLILYRWWNVIFFKDALEAICFDCSKVNFAEKYFFIYTSNIYKPLWTYHVESKKSKVEMLTISSLTELDHIEKNNTEDYEGLSASTWKNFTVWNEGSKNYLKKRIIDKNININVLNSQIYYKDNNINIDIPGRSVAVFTYENHRFNLTHSFLTDWVTSYTSDLHELNKFFWNDLIQMRNKYNFSLYVKKKRNFPKNFGYKKNLRFYDDLIDKNKVIEINNNIAIEKILKSVDLSVSMPFTSPSIVAKYMNKKSIYYDPTKLININDPNSSGIEIISGHDMLNQYFSQIFK